ncbi:MAG: Crp/Fnr family transcriptional regulator [Chloroflexi bacterium]|nr:Crp/Fnr family transcriptional regulator [Chloroflexota bacterium]
MGKSNSLSSGLVPGEESSLKLHLLSKVDIFRDLAQDEMHTIEGMVKMVTCKKGHIFYRPEEGAEVLFLLKRGKVQVYTLTSEGKRLIIETIDPGTFFGEMPLTAQSMHQAFAEAVEDSLICVLSRGDMERLLLEKPQVALRLVDSLSRRLEETRIRLEEATFQNAAARVSRAILRLAQGTLELSGLTHQELADATGLYRETVTNVLNRLQAQGLVELGKKKIIILGRVGLQAVAEI